MQNALEVITPKQNDEIIISATNYSQLLQDTVGTDRSDQVLALIEADKYFQKRQAEIAFNEAMADLQPRMPIIGRKTQGYNAKSYYAKLDDIEILIKGLYTQAGFSVSYSSKRIEDNLDVNAVLDNHSKMMNNKDIDLQIVNKFIEFQKDLITRSTRFLYTGTVKHKCGHSETAEIELTEDISGNKTLVQARGSTFSYAKRYLLCALFNVVLADADKDGQKIKQPINKEAVDEINQLIEETGSDRKKVLKYMEVERVEDIYQDDYHKAISALKNRISRMEEQAK